MKKNMGFADRAIRFSVAVVLFVLYYNEMLIGTVGIIALVVAAIFVVTSLVSICPLYSVLGISTCKTKVA